MSPDRLPPTDRRAHRADRRPPAGRRARRLAERRARRRQRHLSRSSKHACEAGVAEGWLCDREGGGIRYGRIFKPADDLHGFSVDVVDMKDIAGPHHTPPAAARSTSIMPLDGDARFDGRPAGWLVCPPGSAHRPTVTQRPRAGALPAAARRIEFTPELAAPCLQRPIHDRTAVLPNYLGGRWQAGTGAGTALFDPVLGTELVRVDATGLDLRRRLRLRPRTGRRGAARPDLRRARRAAGRRRARCCRPTATPTTRSPPPTAAR